MYPNRQYKTDFLLVSPALISRRRTVSTWYGKRGGMADKQGAKSAVESSEWEYSS